MGDRLKICLVSQLFSPSVGGTQVRMEKQARRLQALGHRVVVVTLRFEKHWRPEEVLDGLEER